MELVAPMSFIYSFLHSPLSPANFGRSPPLSLSHPPTFLSALFLVHYLNRAIVSPLRTPSRSKSHLAVVLCAISFNIVNGSLMGSYLSSPSAALFTAGAFSRPLFWFGIGLWAFGYVGNILHDEVLLNLRRSAQAMQGRRYVLESLRGFDLFPQTAHVESVAILRLVDA